MNNRQSSIVNRQSKDFLFLQISSLPYFRGFLRAIESSYYQDLPLPSPVYDVGCGDGHFASLTFDQKLDVGLDPWRFSMKEAKKVQRLQIARRSGWRADALPVRSLRQRIEQLRARTYSTY
jgi:hypothetical protein